jgi:DNA-binding transcriptional LysR family regulator
MQSISKAAARMRLTQPTVTLQIQALERELHTRLFDRRGPKLEITFEGKQLYEIARPLVDGFSRLDQDFEARKRNVEQGQLAVAAGGSTIQYMLPRSVQRFVAEHPGIALKLNNVTGREGMQMLRDRRVDFCVGPILDTPADIEFEPIVSFDAVLITAAHHPLSMLRKVSLKQISQYPLILPPRDLSTWRQVDLVFLRESLPYEVRLEVGGWEVIKKYVELGLGTSIVMSMCISGEEKLEVINVKKYFPSRVYGIVKLKSRPLSPQARSFIVTLKEVLLNNPE